MDNEKNNSVDGFSHLGLYGTVAAFSYSIIVLHGVLAEKTQKMIEKRLEAIREMKKDYQTQSSFDLEKEYQEKSPNNPLTIFQMLCLDDKRISNKTKVD